MLQSLSSVELSRHAVELEKRSIQLSLEEGNGLLFTCFLYTILHKLMLVVIQFMGASVCILLLVYANHFVKSLLTETEYSIIVYCPSLFALG